MSISKHSNLLSDGEVNYFKKKTGRLEIPLNEDGSFIYEESHEPSISKYLGRLQTRIHLLPNKIIERMQAVATEHLGYENKFSGVSYVEYNAKYGTPDLPPHYDGDSSDLIINYQLSSNTPWNIGLGLKTYELEDNSAILFNPNMHIHWRPHKNFNDGEYVKMLFFRFIKSPEPTDYSSLRYSLDDDVLKEVADYRNSLK